MSTESRFWWWWCSVAQLCPTLCDPMDCSTPGLPVPHHLPEFAQVHVHCIGDDIQPSHPLTPSSSALNLSQHQGFFSTSHLFTSDDQNTGASASASVLPVNIQDRSPLRSTCLIPLLSNWLSEVFSSTIVQRHQFFGIQSPLQPSSHNYMWPLVFVQTSKLRRNLEEENKDILHTT